MGLKDKLTAVPDFRIRPVLRGLIVSYLFIIILSLVFSLIFYLTPLNDSWMNPLGIITATLALFCGGYAAGKAAGNRGLCHGLMVGILFIILVVITSASSGISWSSLLLKSVYSLLASSVGGISGVK